MRNVNIIVSIMVALSAATAAAVKDVPAEPEKPRQFFWGLDLGGVWSGAKDNRIAASGWGAGGNGELGYRPTPSLVAPYVAAGASWGRGEAPEWERGGYYDSAWYMGLLTWRITAGALYRYPVGGPRLSAYGGPAFLAVWLRHEVQDGYGGTMETRSGSGLGWAAIAGMEFVPGPWHAVGIQCSYGQAYASWADLPAAADEGFTYSALQLTGFLRFNL